MFTRERSMVARAVIAATVMLAAGLIWPSTAWGQGSAAPGPGIGPFSEVLGRVAEVPAAAPGPPAVAPAAVSGEAIAPVPPAAPPAAPPPAAPPPVAEVAGLVVEAPPALPPAAAPAVVAPPPPIEEVAGRSIAASPMDEVLAAVAERPLAREGPGLTAARVLPKAGDGAAAPTGPWLPLVLLATAAVFGALGLLWPAGRAPRRR